ncbi:glycoside hydrolase family 73 protein [Lewinella sp. 4G2]|uniref:glycoside hydrolase family 73 protein n=1 Tax=Lewinella sp. 4G2 TaxID=1803372 RepID=UPI0007B4A35D|nr:glucosaminidase domain-containing protein [Lewinella sp. 4G2]OAV43035.1 hypothetical protein A3850_000310 [Lewinella sp. 4G2]
MKQNIPSIPSGLRLLFRGLYHKIHAQVTSPYTKLVVLAALVIIVMQREISFSINIDGGSLLRVNEQSVFTNSEEGPQVLAIAASTSGAESVAAIDDKLSARRNWTKKQLAQLSYVKDFRSAALDEYRRHGIPASITLAQGLLESGHGTSTLARRNNNHFGIKCFSKKCRKGHCSNHSDDHHKDFFRNFSDPFESFAAHSQVLLKNRYKPLFRLGHRDYKGWSHGLRKAGYATDPRYGDKLIRLIEDLELWRYDRISA